MNTSSTLPFIGSTNRPLPAPARHWPWVLLFGRTTLFILCQSLFALFYLITGSTLAWDDGAAWWPVGIFLTNVICFFAMVSLFRSEGKNFWHLFKISGPTLKSDLGVLLASMLITGPLGFFPNIWLSSWLFNDPNQVLDLLVRPLPVWAVWLGVIVLFPISQGLGELPLYFGYVMPRLKTQGVPAWISLLLPSVLLGFQHAAAPLLLNWRFMLWRGLMYLPFAIWIGLILKWRPRLLPYLVIIHILMDLSFAFMFMPKAF